MEPTRDSQLPVSESALETRPAVRLRKLPNLSLLVGLLLTPLLVLVPLILINPMGQAFVEKLTIRNLLPEPIVVTPRGVGENGEQQALPVLASRVPYWPSSRVGGFAIPPGASLVLEYDADDVQLEGVDVEGSDGRYLGIVTSDGSSIVTVRPEELLPASAGAATFDREISSTPMLIALIAMAGLPMAGVLLLMVHRRLSRRLPVLRPLPA